MVRYFFEDTAFRFTGRRFNTSWIKAVAAAEDRSVGDINIIFCSDAYLLEINKKYLSHDYYTDIITFDYCEGKVLSGDLFISVDCVLANAEFYGASFEDELCRVIIHGVLHLIGYDDHTDSDIAMMRRKEGESLELRRKLAQGSGKC